MVTAATDLSCTYLNGLDVVQHALFAASGTSALGASAMADKLAALEDYYLALDRLLAGDLRAAAGELVVVVTSPGRVRNDSGGLLAALGAPVNSRLKDGIARAADVMPTVLHALGVPISRELAGRPLVEMFTAEFARRSPVREVATYGPPRPRHAPRQGQPLDQETIDRLRSLGYVK